MKSSARNRDGAMVRTAFIRRVFFFALALASVQTAHAYTVVQVSTAAPPGLESAFIASTTAQWQATVSVNPFVSGTYSIRLFGPNPLFDPAPTNKELLNALVTVDSMTYVYGWADGINYQQTDEIGIVDKYKLKCYDPSFFSGASTGNWNSDTCTYVTRQIEYDLYNEWLSTTPIAGF